MKQIPFALIFTLILLGCNNDKFNNDVTAIKNVMEQQTQSWNKGDIEGFMKGYWESDNLRFLGRQGLTYGWQTTLDNYKKAYPNTTAMGKLRFDHISFEPLGNDKIFVVGKWALYREKDTLSGYYSLIWKNIDGKWKVIFDHTN